VNALLGLMIALPLLAAGASTVVGRWRSAQRVISLATLTTLLALGIVLLVHVDRDGIVVSQAGGWPAPIGISLVADRLSAIMVTVSAAMLLVVMVYAAGQGGVERERVAFHPVYLVLAAGVCASFLTGDLFTLFVAFEMMLVSSYVLITMGGRPDQVRSGMTYVVISLIASTLFVSALAFVYAATGTVNMADLAGKIAELPDGVRSALSVLLLVVFGIKAGLFPLFFWLPDSYPTAPGPITAIFAGLLTKVGVYAIIRSQTLLFPADSRPATLILVVAGLTMAIGVFGALAQDDVKRILSFHIVSQIGYMIMGLGLFTLAGLAGAVFYVVHHIIVKTALFLVSGLIDRRGGSSRLSEVGGLVRSAPFLAVLFALPALSLAGLPPFSGFIAKFGLVQAGVAQGSWAIVAVSLAVSLLTMFSMTKIWAGAFWGEAEQAPPREPDTRGALGGPRGMIAATATLGAMSVAVLVAAGPLYALAERSAGDLLDPSRYVEAVLGVTP
jgi:multicomponent Na+:H+ antiporter subunit D